MGVTFLFPFKIHHNIPKQVWFYLGSIYVFFSFGPLGCPNEVSEPTLKVLVLITILLNCCNQNLHCYDWDGCGDQKETSGKKLESL